MYSITSHVAQVRCLSSTNMLRKVKQTFKLDRLSKTNGLFKMNQPVGLFDQKITWFICGYPNISSPSCTHGMTHPMRLVMFLILFFSLATGAALFVEVEILKGNLEGQTSLRLLKYKKSGLKRHSQIWSKEDVTRRTIAVRNLEEVFGFKVFIHGDGIIYEKLFELSLLPLSWTPTNKLLVSLNMWNAIKRPK
jgi:hypothetical protein